jgi:predicted dehydrogenase
VHNVVEAGIAGTLSQARNMITTASANGVVFAVAEQFFRLAYDRLAKQVAATEFIGPVNRIVSVFGHTGGHNNAGWLMFYDAEPDSAQAIEHAMPVARHRSLAHRQHTDETFHANFFTFPGPGGEPHARFVADMTSNAKGVLGRHPRPGYTEYEGQRGAITLRTPGMWHGPYHQVEGEVRYSSDEALDMNGVIDTVYPMVFSQENEFLRRLHVDLPTGRVEYVNPFYRPLEDASAMIDYYHAGTAEALLQFGDAIRNGTPLEYDTRKAFAVMSMNVAARESALQDGRRISLPLPEGVEAEQQLDEAFRLRTGRDPLDVEGMLDYAAPRS